MKNTALKKTWIFPIIPFSLSNEGEGVHVA